MCGLALKQRQPVGINFQHVTPLAPLKTVSMTLPRDASLLNFFVEEYSCVLLCTVVYCCVELCTAVYCCVLLCTAVYCCVLLCTAVYCCVLFSLHKQLLFADDCRSEAHFLPITPAPAHSRCTPPYLRVHFRVLNLMKFKFCPALRESPRIERNSVCTSTHVYLKIKKYI